MLDVKELKDQTMEELRILGGDLAKELFELKSELSVARKLPQPHLIKQKRRDRARVLTVLTQKESENNGK